MADSEALAAALGKLHDLENYEKNMAPYGVDRYDPQKTGRLLAYAGIDVSGIRILHVAGTKGKGSTAHYAAAMLRHLFPDEGVGLYTSPHLFSVTERILVDDVEIPGGAVAALVDKHMKLFRDFHCTWFDAFTFIAMAHFAGAGCKWAVLETGLGGRLDSTNFCRPAVSIITPIGFDHTGLLGHTLAAIAKEKAGIIKPGIPAVVALQPDPAWTQIRQRAEDCLSKLVSFPSAVRIEFRGRDENGSVFDATAGNASIPGVRCIQPGDVFAENLLLAALGVREAVPSGRTKPETWAEAIRRAGENVRLPGRMERKGNLVFDVAHNDQSFDALFDILKGYYRAGSVDLCVGILADKELERVAEVIRAHAKMLGSVQVFDFPSERPSGGEKLFHFLSGLPGLEYRAKPEDLAIDPSRLTAVAGSFHTAKWFLKRGESI